MGRPTDYTNEIALQICERIADGQSLRKICRDEEMPDKATVLRWLACEDRADFRALYAKARELQADSYVDDVVDIADTPIEATTTVEKEVAVDKVLQPTTETRTADAVDRSRLRIDARKWAASKLAPKKYGNKLELAGDADNPIVFEKIERVIVDPADPDSSGL